MIEPLRSSGQQRQRQMVERASASRSSSTHFADLKRFDDTGNLKMGGALLEEIPADDEPSSLKINGSTLVVEATSKEEIMEILKGDVYTREGVWDLEKVQMWPFKCALRSAMN
ncbi:hypothetical protein RB598_001750 [Gaeumannomyces tritici]